MQEKNEDSQEVTMHRKSESLFAKYMRVVGVVSLYWAVSISLVFLNKYLLKSDDLKLNAPLFVTWFQCVVTVLLCYCCSFIGSRCPASLTFPDLKFDRKLSREALPLSVVFVSMITFNNLCLLEVGIAFYTVARSLVTIFSIIFTYIILGKKTTPPALVCCSIVIGGFFLGVNQEGSIAAGGLSIKGVIYGVIASAMVALNAIYIKKVLPAMDNDIWKLTYYNNVNACAIFVPLMLLSEMRELWNFPLLFSPTFWMYMSASGFFGFIMGFVVGLEIKVTTPVTHTISGVAKACLQTVIAVLYYHETKTSLWWVSNLLVLTGTGSYSVVKSLDMKKSHQQTRAKSDEDRQEKQSLV